MRPHIDICDDCNQPIIGTVYSRGEDTLCHDCRFSGIEVISLDTMADSTFDTMADSAFHPDLNESTWTHGAYNSFAPDDMVNKPPHYNQAGIECIDAMKAMTEGTSVPPHEAYCWQNAFKYLWRWPYKNGVQDLRKAQWYLDRLIKQMEGA